MELEPRHYFVDDGNYIVFEDGRVFKKLNPPVSSSGYKFVRIGKKSYPLHRVIALTFIPNPENKPEVNHIDGNKQNNAVSNLEWATRKENAQHAAKHGLLRPRKRKLPLISKNFRRLREQAGLSQKQLADLLGIDQSAVSLWEQGKTAPTAAKIVLLAEALGCEPGDLFAE